MQATETEGLEGKLDDENSGTADFSGVEKESRLLFLGNAQTGEIREQQLLSSLSNCQRKRSPYCGTSTKSAFSSQVD